jgi:hypothetical protein
MTVRDRTRLGSCGGLINRLLPVILLSLSLSTMAGGYDQPKPSSPEEWATQYPPSNPNADPNAPRGFNSIRGGNQLYGTGANQGSGFVKDQLGNWHGTGALSGKTCIQMPYGGVSCR